MLWRQRGWCCFRFHGFCPGELHMSEATFEHENKRGKDRDDRIEVDGKPINGAAHGFCNSVAGSRRLKIWHGEQ